MSRSITVTGDERTEAHLLAIGRRALRQQPVFTVEAKRTAERVKVTAVDTGRLRDSVEVLDVDWDGFTVGTTVPYAHYVFNGTQYVKAQPPKVPRGIARETAYAMARDIVR